MVVVVVAGSLLGRVVGDCGEVLKNAKLTTLRFQIDALSPLIKFPIFSRLPDLINPPPLIKCGHSILKKSSAVFTVKTDYIKSIN